MTRSLPSRTTPTDHCRVLAQNTKRSVLLARREDDRLDRGSMRKTSHGAGPWDGALNGAWMREPDASGSTGQPWSTHACAMRATTSGSLTRGRRPLRERHRHHAPTPRPSSGGRGRRCVPYGLRRSGTRTFPSTHTAPTAVVCGLPSSFSVVSHVVRAFIASAAGRRTRVELVADAVPLDRRQSVLDAQVDRFHCASPVSLSCRRCVDRERDISTGTRTSLGQRARRRRPRRPCAPAARRAGSRRPPGPGRSPVGYPIARPTATSAVPPCGSWSSALSRTSVIALRSRVASRHAAPSRSACCAVNSPADAAADSASSVRVVRSSGTDAACASCSSWIVHSMSVSPPRPSLVCVVGSAPRGSRSSSTRAFSRRISTRSAGRTPGRRIADRVDQRREPLPQVRVADGEPRAQQRLRLPRRRPPLVVLRVRGERADQRTAAPLRTQVGVHAQRRVGRRRRRQQCAQLHRRRPGRAARRPASVSGCAS